MEDITFLDKILHKLFKKHLIHVSPIGVVYCRICGRRWITEKDNY